MDLLSTGHRVIRLGGYNAGAAGFTPNEHISQGRARTPVSSSISLGFQDGRLQPASPALLPLVLCTVIPCTSVTLLPQKLDLLEPECQHSFAQESGSPSHPRWKTALLPSPLPAGHLLGSWCVSPD